MGVLADAAGIPRGHCVDARAKACDLVREFANAPGLNEQRAATEADETAFIILAAGIGFERRQAARLRLAVEEMLTERIMDAYSAVGDIRVGVTLMPGWLRVWFSDDGAEYVIDKRRDTSMSAHHPRVGGRLPHRVPRRQARVPHGLPL